MLLWGVQYCTELQQGLQDLKPSWFLPKLKDQELFAYHFKKCVLFFLAKTLPKHIDVGFRV